MGKPPALTGKMVLPPGEHLPVEKLAPGSTEEYRRLRDALLREYFGKHIEACRHCGRPMIIGYNCRWCRGVQ